MGTNSEMKPGKPDKKKFKAWFTIQIMRCYQYFVQHAGLWAACESKQAAEGYPDGKI